MLCTFTIIRLVKRVKLGLDALDLLYYIKWLLVHFDKIMTLLFLHKLSHQLCKCLLLSLEKHGDSAQGF